MLKEKVAAGFALGATQTSVYIKGIGYTSVTKKPMEDMRKKLNEYYQGTK